MKPADQNELFHEFLVIINNLNKVGDIEVIRKIDTLILSSPLQGMTPVTAEILEYYTKTGLFPESEYIYAKFPTLGIPPITTYTSGLQTKFIAELQYCEAQMQAYTALVENDLSKARQILDKANKEKGREYVDIFNPFDMATGLKQEIRDRLNRPRGFLIGIPDIDKAIRGYHPRKVHVIAAPTSQFKTTLELSLVYNAIMGLGTEPKKVFVLLLEGEAKEIWSGLVARHSWEMSQVDGGLILNLQNLKHGEVNKEQLARHDEVLDDLMSNMKGRLIVRDTSNMNISVGDLRKALDEDSETMGGLDVVFVDHITLLKNYRVQGIRDSRETMSYWVQELANICMDFNHGEGLIMMLLVQVNRDGMKHLEDQAKPDAKTKKRKSVSLAILADCADIERIANTALILSSPEHMKVQGFCDIFLAKNRDGYPLDEPVVTTVKAAQCLVGDRVFEDFRKRAVGQIGFNLVGQLEKGVDLDYPIEVSAFSDDKNKSNLADDIPVEDEDIQTGGTDATNG